MKIERTSDPGPFSDRRHYVSHLRALFRCRCAYCITPDDRLGGEEGMKVDHFHSESRFPELRLVWSNLYYSCDVCNNRKSDHPRKDEEAQGFRFVDPCAEDPDDHFRMVRDAKTGDFCRVTHLSDAAEYTIRCLQFNRRRFLRDFWRELDAAERKCLNELGVVQNLQKLIGEPDQEARQLLAAFESKLKAIRGFRPFPLDTAT